MNRELCRNSRMLCLPRRSHLLWFAHGRCLRQLQTFQFGSARCRSDDARIDGDEFGLRVGAFGRWPVQGSRTPCAGACDMQRVRRENRGIVIAEQTRQAGRRRFRFIVIAAVNTGYRSVAMAWRRRCSMTLAPAVSRESCKSILLRTHEITHDRHARESHHQ